MVSTPSFEEGGSGLIADRLAGFVPYLHRIGPMSIARYGMMGLAIRRQDHAEKADMVAFDQRVAGDRGATGAVEHFEEGPFAADGREGIGMVHRLEQLAHGAVVGSGLDADRALRRRRGEDGRVEDFGRHVGLAKALQAGESKQRRIGIALGASYGGAIGVTSTSGPGIALKSETIGLGVMTELPLLVIDVQRGGPSTGLPTKTEQADLLQAMFGRNGESPVPIVAPQSPSDCFDAVVDATRIALKYRTPVLFLSDGAIANGSEPWLIPDVDTLPDLSVEFATDPETFQPYSRDPETLARPWAVPGTPGLQHRIGGLEKQDITGNISYDPENHDRMVRLRQAKIDGIEVPDVEVEDPSGEAKVLVVGWGSSYGPIGAAARRVRKLGLPVAHAHLRHLNPFPKNLGEVLKKYEKVIVPEMNLGQLALLLRAKYLVDAVSYTKVQGLPFKAEELQDVLADVIKGVSA